MRKVLVLWLLCACAAFAQTPDDSEVDAGKAYAAAGAVNGWAGARSFIYLYNPAGSGKTVYVDKMITAHSYNGGSGCDLRSHNTSFGTHVSNGTNKFLGLPDSSAKLMYGNTQANHLPGRILYECWQGVKFDDGTYEFKPAIRLSAGYGVLLSSAHDGTTLVGTFEFREY